MTITFPIDLPNDGFAKRMTWRDRNTVGVTEAPFSGEQQIQEFQRQVWEVELEFPPMAAARGAKWISAFRSLRGQRGTFLCGNPKLATPKGTASVTPGTPQVDGAGQTGLVLNMKTGLTTQVGYLLAGCHFSLGTGANRHLHAIVSDVDLDADGKATLNIWPRLRAAPDANAEIILTSPTGLFRLVGAGVQADFDEIGNVFLETVPIREAI